MTDQVALPVLGVCLPKVKAHAIVHEYGLPVCPLINGYASDQLETTPAPQIFPHRLQLGARAWAEGSLPRRPSSREASADFPDQGEMSMMSVHCDQYTATRG